MWFSKKIKILLSILAIVANAAVPLYLTASTVGAAAPQCFNDRVDGKPVTACVEGNDLQPNPPLTDDKCYLKRSVPRTVENTYTEANCSTKEPIVGGETSTATPTEQDNKKRSCEIDGNGAWVDDSNGGHCVCNSGFNLTPTRGDDGVTRDICVISAEELERRNAEEGDERSSCEDNDGEFVFFQCAIIRGASEVINELDSRVRSALEIKPEYYENDGLKGAWANFRNIAYIILIPVMLVMVIGTALGFSFVDAYTVKRALPRLFFAIIFIALSYEICVLLIEFVDMIGKGVGGLIAAPFGGSDELTLANIFDPSALSGATALGAGVIGGIALVGVGAVSLGILASYLLVGALALIIIFALLTMREIIIVFLIILAPLAIIAWIFPGNDKMWKLWWNAFSKLLLLFPIIIGLLVIGRAFALIIAELPSDGAEGIFLTFAKLVAYIGPFFFIPTIFRYAGGAFANLAGLVNNRSKGVFDRQRKYRQKTKAQNWERHGKRTLTQKRADYQSRLQGQASKGGVRGFAASLGSRAVGGYNVQALDSEVRERVSKELNAQIATGRDDEIRGLTVNKRAANKSWEKDKKEGKLRITRDANGNITETESADGLRKVKKDGTVQYKSLGGAWVNEAAVDEGYRRWGNDTYAQQTALSYEMRKAMSSDQVEGIGKRYSSLAMEGWGNTANQAGGAWIGASFENQNQHIEFKNMSHSFDKNNSDSYDAGTLDINKFVNEVYEKKGSYPLSQMSGHTIEQLSRAYDEADRTNNEDVKNKISAISEMFVQRGASLEPGLAPTGKDGAVQPMQQPTVIAPDGQTQGAQTTARTYASGPASVNEQIHELAYKTGRLETPPTQARGSAGGPQ